MTSIEFETLMDIERALSQIVELLHSMDARLQKIEASRVK